MIPVDKALAIVLDAAPRLGSERASDFLAAMGRVLAEDVLADSDLPPFPRSAVDGFALRASDLEMIPARLAVKGVVPAGVAPSFSVGPREAAHVMTGAPVPDGADAVQMVEKTREVSPDVVEILEALGPGDNVSPRGHEVKKGDRVLCEGTRIDPAVLAVLATVGMTEPLVGRVPRVAVIATGNELVPPSEEPGPGQIRNSNGFSLTAQAAATGAEVHYLGVAQDDVASLTARIAEGLSRDVVLLSGGVSMGRFDLVEDVLKKFDVRILVDAVALKPGKPLVFGVAPGGKLVFGLPGNPVSTMVTFELFVRPALAKMEGANRVTRPVLRARLTAPLASKGPRRAYLPGWVFPADEGRLAAEPIPTRGSADIVAFAKANALLIVPAERDRLETGAAVEILQLDNFFHRANRCPRN